MIVTITRPWRGPAWVQTVLDKAVSYRTLCQEIATIGPGIDTVARDKAVGRHYRAKPQGRAGPHADQSGQITYPPVTLPAYHAMHVGGSIVWKTQPICPCLQITQHSHAAAGRRDSSMGHRILSTLPGPGITAVRLINTKNRTIQLRSRCFELQG